MRVCLIATEIFAHGIYGGFGALTRKIAQGLASKGVEVYVVMPRYPNQKPVEVIDNFTVISYPGPGHYIGMRESMRYKSIFELIDADIYHSEEPSIGTCLAQKSVPQKKHVVTFQDPRTLEDWKKEWEAMGLDKISIMKWEIKFKISYSSIKRAVKKADALFSQAWYAIPKAMKIYKLKEPPKFLPNPVEIPKRNINKADEPTVCFLARWDLRKRPEYFFELAKRFPDVKFIAMGKAGDAERDKLLREKYKNIPNLIMTGFVSEEEKSKILEKSWILINTSWRECLPVAYLEACAHKCAILSHENPDDFAKKFGYHAKVGDLNDFERGLNWLLEEDKWRELGKRGYEYVKEVHEFNKVINEHIKIYEELLGEGE